MNPIDIYNYPSGPDVTVKDVLDYQIAVMQAARDGATVEIEVGPGYWEPLFYTTSVHWNWGAVKYRIASKVAAGHNPHRLTEQQVGVSEGWRLLAPGEIGEHEKDDAPGEIECWVAPAKRWNGVRNHGWDSEETYRTKAAPGRFLPRPDSKVAEGHNPERLTEDQVGTNDGWRLLTAEEMREDKQPGVEYFDRFALVWAPASDWSLCASSHYPVNTYRTKAAPGEYTPKTTLSWLKRLPQPIRDLALARRNVAVDGKESASLSQALLNAFIWDLTPEGHDFWERVCHAAGTGDPFPEISTTKPWALETFVWPRCVRLKDHKHAERSAVLAAQFGGVVLNTGYVSWSELAKAYECSYDYGTTWHPCGETTP